MADRAVIVGSGIGGLASAASLAKSGWDVLTLEQNAQLGGYLAPFERGGFEFTPGVHYVGEARSGGRLHEGLAQLEVDAESAFAELDPDGFDVYRFPGTEIRMCRGADRYEDRLASHFPHERDGLARFFRTVRAIGDAIASAAPTGATSLRARIRQLASTPTLLRWQGRTYGDLLGSHLRDPHLRAILAAAGGAYGLPPGRASALVGAGLLAHYLEQGAFFPRGGSGALRDRIVETARRHGARFRTDAAVAEILLRDGKAVGVRLESGERIDADAVISDADPVVTYGRLLPPGTLHERMRRKVQSTEHTLGSFALYLGMRRDLRRHGLGAMNVWDYPDWDLDALYARLEHGPLRQEPFFFLSPNSLKDDTGALAPEGCSTLEIVVLMPYAPFERFRDLPPGHRGPDYEAEKRRIGDWLLEAVERRWPGLVGDVEVREASTPATNESYVRAVRGAAYGPALIPRQTGLHAFRTTTPIPALFLAGAGVFGDGITPCLQSGLAAARAAMRRASRARAPIARPFTRPHEARP